MALTFKGTPMKPLTMSYAVNSEFITSYVRESAIKSVRTLVEYQSKFPHAQPIELEEI